MKREYRGWRQGARRAAATALAVCLAASALPTTGLAEGLAKETSDVLVQGFHQNISMDKMAQTFRVSGSTLSPVGGTFDFISGTRNAYDQDYQGNYGEKTSGKGCSGNITSKWRVPLTASWKMGISYSISPMAALDSDRLDANNLFYLLEDQTGATRLLALVSTHDVKFNGIWSGLGITAVGGDLNYGTTGPGVASGYAWHNGGENAYGSNKSSVLAWDAQSQVMSAQFAGETISSSNQNKSADGYPPLGLDTNQRLSILLSNWNFTRKSKVDSVLSKSQSSVTLNSIGYDHFAPEFVKVEYLDPKDQTRVITGGIGRGQEAVVRVTLKNGDLAAAGETIPAFLSLGDQAGFVSEGFETTQISGTKKIALNFVGNDEISATFKIKVTGDPETQFKLGLKVEDDPFGSYRSAYILHDIGPDMVKGGVFPGDVNYTLTGTAGSNGWYTSNVDLNIQTNDYDLAYFDGVLADRMGKTFTQEGKTTTSFYAQQDGSRFASKWGTTGIMSESLGIDKTAPTLALTDRSTLALRAQDRVSGVWKIQVKRPGATSWEDMTTYTLTPGGAKPGDTGASSRDYQALNDCNALGTYQFRAVDAAGNVTPDDKVLTVTRTDVAPVIVADDSLVFYGEKLPSGLVPRTAFDMIAGDDAPITHLSTNGVKTPAAHNALPPYTDLSGQSQNRVQLPDDQISWKLERLGLTASSFPVQSGSRSTQPVAVELPAGSYKLTFSLKGVDDDGNAALPKECFLYILRGGSPDVGGPTPSGEGEPGYHPDVPNDQLPDEQPDPSVDDEGKMHRDIYDEITELITTPAAGGGSYGKAEMEALFARRYQVTSTLPAPDDALDWGELTIAKGGVPTDTMDTARQGTYLVERTATDRAGNTTTIHLTYHFVYDSGIEPPVVTPGGGEGNGFPPLPDELPDGTLKPDETDPNRLHRDICDEVVEYVRPNPSFGGLLTGEKAEAWLAQRYQITSSLPWPADTLSRGPVSMSGDLRGGSFPTGEVGSCVITQTVTDEAGNTTTIHLTYRIIEAAQPPVVIVPDHPDGGSGGGSGGQGENGGDNSSGGGQGENGGDSASGGGQGENGSDSASGGNQGENGRPAPDGWPDTNSPDGGEGGLYPLPPVVETDEEGLRHALIRDKVTVLIGRELLYGGSLSDEEARELMEERYQIVSGLPAPDDGLTYFPVEMSDLSGRPIAAIDTAHPGDYLIRWGAADAQGNTTTILLWYQLVEEEEGDTPAPPPSPTPGEGEGGDALGPNGGGQTAELGETTQAGGAPYTGERGPFGGGAHTGHAPGSCIVHWLALLGTVITGGYVALRLVWERREEEEEHEVV